MTFCSLMRPVIYEQYRTSSKTAGLLAQHEGEELTPKPLMLFVRLLTKPGVEIFSRFFSFKTCGRILWGVRWNGSVPRILLNGWRRSGCGMLFNAFFGSGLGVGGDFGHLHSNLARSVMGRSLSLLPSSRCRPGGLDPLFDSTQAARLARLSPSVLLRQLGMDRIS